jgi:polyisoprenoid-binding protein YceI
LVFAARSACSHYKTSGDALKIRNAVLFLLFASLTALAQTSNWDIDPNHSAAHFTVRHMGLSNVTGTFDKVSGTAKMDDKDLTKSSVDAVIDVASVDTRVQMRDNDLRSDHFFDVAKYPTMEFKSKRIEKQGDGYKMIGDLTMHGATKEVTLNMDEPSGIMTDSKGNMHRGFSASTTINRQDWGMTFNSKVPGGEAVVGDTIKIQIDAELVKKKS